MWILFFLFLLIPLLPLEELSDRDVEKYPDYRMEQGNVEMDQFAAYTTAVRRKMTLTDPQHESDVYWNSWTDADLENYRSSPVLKFPLAPHGNCVSRNQHVTVQRINPDGTTRSETKSADFRVTWITPTSVRWKKYTKHFNEHFFGIYDAATHTIHTSGNWGSIELCQNPSKDSYFFVVEQSR